MVVNIHDVIALLIATLGGAAVGLEREWSGHAEGPRARFAGIRTFALLGLQAGVAGWLWSNGSHALAIAMLSGSAALVVAAYVAGSRTEVDGTTEISALLVLAAGLIAGMHEIRLASGIFAVTSLLLAEKSKLHGLVRRLDDASLRAAFRFAVMAIVILPILPAGPFGPLGGIRPRQLWTLMLFFSALSFLGYIARRAVGKGRGYPLAGLLGGIVSSTSVTFSFARTSRNDAQAGNALALGVVGACAVMCLRVLVTTAVLNFPVSLALLPFLLVPFLLAAGMTLYGFWHAGKGISDEHLPDNPLQFASALQMCALFQVVMFAVHWAQTHWGNSGVYFSAGVLGLTDIDALVVSMTKGTENLLPVAVTARSIVIGVLSNTMLKLSIGVVVGTNPFRKIVALSLSAIAIACLVALVVCA